MCLIYLPKPECFDVLRACTHLEKHAFIAPQPFLPLSLPPSLPPFLPLGQACVTRCKTTGSLPSTAD
jgi:hypothetical protein